MNLQEIVENAPEGSTHFYESGAQPLSYLMVKGNHCKYWNSLDVWSIPISNAEDIFIHSKPRLIDDARLMVKMCEMLNGVTTQVSKTSTVHALTCIAIDEFLEKEFKFFTQR